MNEPLLHVENLSVVYGRVEATRGVSLTVNEVTDQPDGTANFAINIIPHTWSVTAFADVQPGQAVNLEIDVLARYLARMREVMDR